MVDYKLQPVATTDLEVVCATVIAVAVLIYCYLMSRKED